MVTDPAEVERLAREREAENLEFRRLLHQRPAQAEMLHTIGAEVAAAIDCCACAACCRQTRVEIGQLELERIAAFLKLRPAEVLRLYTEPGPGPMLAQPGGECVFLDHGLCLIYEARPEACRRFPYLMETETSLGSRLASIWRRAWFCPIVFNSIEELKHRAGFVSHSGR